MTGRDPSQLPADLGRLPADLGVRAATSFYLRRLTILAALIGLSALVPAAVVLVARGPGLPAKVLVVLVLIVGGLYVLDSIPRRLAGGGVFAIGAMSLRLYQDDEDEDVLAEYPAHHRWPHWFELLPLIPGGRSVGLALELLRRRLRRRR